MSKTKQAPQPPPSLDQATEAARAYQIAKQMHTKLSDECKAKVAKTNADYAARLAEQQTGMDAAEAIMREYAEATYGVWEKKSQNLQHCTIGFRVGKAKLLPLENRDWDYVAKQLQKTDYKTLVISKLEVNQAGVLALKDQPEFDKLAKKIGVEVQQAETFYVTAQ